MTIPFPRLAALAVLLRGSEVLLARRRNPPDAGLWGYPGGHVDAGESVAVAALRELREETGVIAEPLRYLGGLDVILPAPGGGWAHHFFLVPVLCRHVAGDPVPQDDVADAAWFPVARILARDLEMSVDVDTVLSEALAWKAASPPSRG
ncbi:NUDIX hydrolase [Plastorhodobacter daqingensis]|uniref:NUDIX hydrolase n=1 Tax=Plastorhodobacter daqingensis TaxID=1387281 RepID=A0ABW2UI52_9RHOB